MLEEPSSNAAVEGLRATFEMPNTLDEPPADFSGMAEDFVYEDHRSGVVNFGRLDASGWSRFMGSLWGLDSGRVHRSIRDVIAVEGQRAAAAAVRIDYGNEMFTEFILCLRVDPEMSHSERIAHYDIDDVDAAIADLGRMHAEIDDLTPRLPHNAGLRTRDLAHCSERRRAVPERARSPADEGDYRAVSTGGPVM